MTFSVGLHSSKIAKMSTFGFTKLQPRLKFQVIHPRPSWPMTLFYSPALKKWGYIGFGFTVIPSVHHNFVSAQYLENNFIEFNQILYVH